MLKICNIKGEENKTKNKPIISKLKLKYEKKLLILRFFIKHEIKNIGRIKKTL
jgi:hypothetical protein